MPDFMQIDDLAREPWRIGQLQIIDVRSETEYATGHIPGAVSMPMPQLEARLGDLSRAVPLVLVCQSGRRATMAAEILEQHRISARVLTGGTVAWTDAGQELVASVATRWSLERQVRLGAGVMVLAALALAWRVDPRWAILAALVGAGLTFAGLTDVCFLGRFLAIMPWNRSARRAPASASSCAR